MWQALKLFVKKRDRAHNKILGDERKKLKKIYKDAKEE